MSVELLNQQQACKELNISRGTILAWEKKGLISPYRTSGKHRRYKKTDLLNLLGIENSNEDILNNNKKCVIYCRVSTKKQSESGNLKRQQDRIVDFASKNNYEIDKVFSEIASGINENRKELDRMFKYIKKYKIPYLLIEYKDRLARFGYNYIEQICSLLDVKIIILENIDNLDINQEMAQDIISIITSFSAKLYGRRGAKNVRKALENSSKEV